MDEKWKEEYRNILLDITSDYPDVKKIVQQHIPSHLYKYGSFRSQYWKDVIYKAQIYLSSPVEFNDPFDCKANFDYKLAVKGGKFRDELNTTIEKDIIEKIPDEFVQKVIETMRKNVFVFCFSEVWNSILMWAHYADSYSGYCIEYDMNKVRGFLTENLYPVLYEKEYIDITNSLIYTRSKPGLICHLAKAKEWEYEKEWRIIENNQKAIYFRKALKAVYLGINCSKKIEEDIVKWAENNNKEVYLIKESRTRYELERHRII